MKKYKEINTCKILITKQNQGLIDESYMIKFIYIKILKLYIYEYTIYYIYIINNNKY